MLYGVEVIEHNRRKVYVEADDKAAAKVRAQDPSNWTDALDPEFDSVTVSRTGVTLEENA